MSSIEWTEKTWNPVTGCTPVSAGCDHCYARRMAKRLQGMGQPRYANGFDVTCHPEALGEPLRWKKPRMVFVGSMGDLFHEDVPDEFIQSVFEIMWNASQHTYQILTKRAERLPSLVKDLPWPKNVWLGVSVENRKTAYRLMMLRSVPAALRFVSFEPLLEDVGAQSLASIDWAIVGGESGPKARPMHPEWARSIRDQCQAAGVPFFFKQWGGVNKKTAGRFLDGRTWDEMPATADQPKE
jgi:protein gp37